MQYTYIYILWIFIFSCGKINNKNSFVTDNDTLLSYRNITIYTFTDSDSLPNIVCYDDKTGNIDSEILKYNSELPSIILKDLNKDNENDVLVIFNFTDNISLLRYWGYFSNENSILEKPELNFKNKKLDFFNNNEMLNYNLRIVNDTLLMFQHWYSTVAFYKIKKNTVQPIIQLSRGVGDFEEKEIWLNEIQDWDSIQAVDKNKDIFWLELIKENWGKPFIGEWY